nr:CrcB family protein [Melghirimyces algeriensis]
MMDMLCVAAGGFLGAITRFLLGQWLNRTTTFLPWGTLTVNLLGSFLLGWMFGMGWNGRFLLFAGTGFMGAFTTFSTLHWEGRLYWKNRQWLQMILYLGITYTVGILFALLGYKWGLIG